MPFTKGTKRGAPRGSRSDSEDELATKPAKKNKNSENEGSASGVDKEGNAFWDLSNKRRIGISQFKNTTFVNVREYYEKDGEMLPGKKGISLTVAQYETLVKVIPAINEKLRMIGHDIENVKEDGDAPTAVESAKKSSREKSKAKKSNIEATSDEEST
ncbi:putative RNA polymerase II transcriptional coactivator [Colletotrichum tanaceti]|uniref:Putative RNA polymerase II transcriptional coactivator n=1 Tax=Colletotrichum tanaceti TaxID=1306861 RepID=A0A4U6XI08_9PEZI|nr:putative RNA polymerase II transcriptional coactivator [Colletotrichum tanaceti]TKW55411.1 putative RNA polymerase II transcriptional coactivator [Colletotrichum tanaceti]